MTLSPLKEIESIPELAAGLSARHKARLANFRTSALQKYRPYPSMASLIGFFGWMIIFGKGTDVLEGHPQWDVLGFLRSLGLDGIVIVLLLGYGIAIFLGIIAYQRVRVVLLGRALRRALGGNRCLWCDYLLKGLEAKEGGVRCPECGECSPSRNNRI
ncbi:MAG: hypothetical protein MI923_12825 [Phycisphaerales bacterium]|nr:hypothetical protein [Phycisphaerales bacterium]